MDKVSNYSWYNAMDWIVGVLGWLNVRVFHGHAGVGFLTLSAAIVVVFACVWWYSIDKYNAAHALGAVSATTSLEKAPPNPELGTPLIKELTVAEKRQIVSDLMASYRARSTQAVREKLDAGDLVAIEKEEKWINRELREKGRRFMVTLPRAPQLRPKSRGILVEGSSNVTIEGNTISGYDEAISIKDSPGATLRRNKISGPEQPQQRK
jgi:parallel beta-helix repeat protein